MLDDLFCLPAARKARVPRRYYLPDGREVHVQKTGESWESWINGEDHTTFLGNTKREVLEDAGVAL